MKMTAFFQPLMSFLMALLIIPIEWWCSSSLSCFSWSALIPLRPYHLLYNHFMYSTLYSGWYWKVNTL